MVITNILSHSFGVEIFGSKYNIIIPKGTEYPCKNSHIYTTVYDFQKKVTVKIYEGEDENNVANDYYYDKYDHNDIEKNLAGIPKIRVTFEFDKNRVLHVSSEDLKTRSSGRKSVEVN